MNEIGTPCADYTPPLFPVQDLIAVPSRMKILSHPGLPGTVLSGTFELRARGNGNWPVYVKQLAGTGQLVVLSAANYGNERLDQPWPRGPILFEHFMGGYVVHGFVLEQEYEDIHGTWAGSFHRIGGHHEPKRYQWVGLSYRPVMLFPGDTFSVTFKDVKQDDFLKVEWIMTLQPPTPASQEGSEILRPKFGIKFRGPMPIQ